MLESLATANFLVVRVSTTRVFVGMGAEWV